VAHHSARHPTRDPGDELVEVVDENDRVLRVVTRREMRAGRLRHRAVFVAVVHPSGRLLVHRRSLLKDLWPGWWDIAVGGVVGVGEPYEVAAVRELAEEVGLDIVRAGVRIEALDGGRRVTYEDDDVALVGRLFRVVSPGPFDFADGEVVEARLVDEAELQQMLREVPFLPDSLTLLRPLLDLA
jgi:isopentenyldiphosphate isomerase